MAEIEKTKYCSNCEAQIPLSKYILHERMCSINVKKCSICKKPITVEDIEDHNKEYHKLIECEYCKKQFSKNKIEEHKNKCDCKLVECEYCGMPIAKKEKKNHEYICGSKTEQCLICKKLITKKEMKNHKINGCKSPEEELLNNKNNIYDDIYERENRKRIQEMEERSRRAKLNNNNNKKNNINNKQIQNPLPINNNVKVQNPLPIKNNNENKPINENIKNNINNKNNNTKKNTGITTIKFGTNKPIFKSNSISNNTNINNNNNNNNNNINNKKNQQPIKVNENIIGGKLIEENNEESKNKNLNLGKRQSKPSINVKFGETNSSKNILNQSGSKNSFRESKTSFKFNPKIEIKNDNKLMNNYYNNPIRNNNIRKNSSKPFGKINFDDGDFLPDDVVLGGGNFDDEKEIQEAIQRSLWQK